MPAAHVAVAFERPGGETCVPSRARPVDLVHLARQTLGDRGIEQEVLGLFIQQLRSLSERLVGCDNAERVQLAHGLKGSARAVGAFAVADCAERIENDPGNRALLRRLAQEADRVRQFIVSISR